MKLKSLGNLSLLPVEKFNRDDAEFDFFPRPKGKTILYPLLVSKERSGYRIIYGHHLLEQFTNSGFSMIPSIIAKTRDPRDTLIAAINYHKNIGDILPSALSKILLFMERHRLSRDPELLYLLKMADYADFCDELKRISSFPQPVRDYLDSKKAPIKVCYLTSIVTPSTKDFILSLIKRLSPSLSIFTEIIYGVYEVSRRKKLDVASVVTKYSLIDSIEHGDLNSLRKQIRRLCFPTISKLNDKIEKEVKKLRLPASVKLHWDWTLERKAISINIEFDSISCENLRGFLSSGFYNDLKRLLDKM